MKLSSHYWDPDSDSVSSIESSRCCCRERKHVNDQMSELRSVNSSLSKAVQLLSCALQEKEDTILDMQECTNVGCWNCSKRSFLILIPLPLVLANVVGLLRRHQINAERQMRAGVKVRAAAALIRSGVKSNQERAAAAALCSARSRLKHLRGLFQRL